MHGLGDSAAGHVDIFLDEKLDIAPTNCKVILPTATPRAVSVNNGMKMNSWFDIRFTPPGAKVEEKYSQEEVKESVRLIRNIVDKEAQSYNGDYSKIFMGGFS